MTWNPECFPLTFAEGGIVTKILPYFIVKDRTGRIVHKSRGLLLALRICGAFEANGIEVTLYIQ